MIEEKKKVNRPLIYAILGVTILILAVSGSAYAFFTASATSDEFTGTTLDVKINKPKVEKVSTDGAKGAGLIPIYDGSVSGHEEQLTTATNSTNKCVDKNGYTVCKIYKVTITNGGSSETTIDTSVTLNDVTGTNITWAKMTGENTFDSLKGSDNTLAAGTSLGANGTVTQYFVVYLKNTGANQTSTDAGKSFSGTVTVTASTGAQIEASFNS